MNEALAQESIDVSAIVIARNEEGNIADCLQSVLRALGEASDSGVFRTFEVLFVDSASTDRTVELASRFPITIVRLRRNWPLSAAAGKASGARLARGKVFLFVDSDHIFDSEWIPFAWGLLQDPKVGAVWGWELEDAVGNTILARVMRNENRDGVPEVEKVDSVATGLVKRVAYEEVGGLHPFLRGAEDRDLGLRLVARGWTVLRTRRAMATHRWTEPGREFTYLGYFRSVAIWSLGDGQACRARWRDLPLRRTFLARYGTLRYAIEDLKLGTLIALMLLNLLGALRGGWLALPAVTADAAFLAAFRTWGHRRGRSWRESVFDFQGALYGPLRQAFFALGLLRMSPAPETYPRDVELVQLAGPTAATRGERT